MRRICPTTIALLLLASASLGAAPRWIHAATVARAPALHVYTGLPVSFEPNRGQTNASVQFLAHMPGYTAFITRQTLVLSLSGPAPSVPIASATLAGSRPGARRGDLRSPARAPAHQLGQADERGSPLPPAPTDGFYRPGALDANGSPATHSRSFSISSAQLSSRATAVPSPVVRLTLSGTSTRTNLTGRDRLPGTVSYFIGNDPHRWHTDIPTFARVVEHDVYPGIDLQYYGNAGRLEFDWVLRPRANPASIRQTLTGPAGARLDARGDLILPLPGGSVIEQRPAAYQTTGARRVPVPAQYRLGPNGVVGVTLGAYDHKQPLVIDPTLGYSRAIGGSRGVQGLGIAVDRAGDAFVVGATQSSNFPTVHPIQRTIGTDQDAFVAKFDPTGHTLLYSTYLGGSQGDDAIDVAVDRSGEAYITGETLSTNFPTMNPLQAHNRTQCTAGTLRVPCDNAFIAKLNPTGDRLVYSTYLGGNTWDEGDGIAVDSSGAAYVTGKAYSTNFPTVHPIQAHKGTDLCPDPSGIIESCADAYIAKIDPSGRRLLFSTYLGGDYTTYGNSVAVNEGHAYLTGFTMADDFPLAHAIHRESLPDGNVFVAELSADGAGLIYSTFIGGDGENALGIAAHSGTAYVTSYSPDNVSYITRLAPNGTGIEYRTTLSADGEVNAGSIAIDRAGDAVIAGDTTAPHLATVNPVQASYGGKHDAFVAALDPAGHRWIETTYLGGSQDDFGQAVAVDRSGNAYVTGITYSSNLPVTNGASTTNGMFVARIAVAAP